ncbi:hypothetical protein B0H14DRAFT_2573711 [Mycena olivaceomarginata]|nr:hypothetical protein B0H14DRAFT_2573711 [Mycena olivaceomarginata]
MPSFDSGYGRCLDTRRSTSGQPRTPPATPSPGLVQPTSSSPVSDIHARRARLVRRASPVVQPLFFLAISVADSLLRRNHDQTLVQSPVQSRAPGILSDGSPWQAPEMERRRQHARDEARRILKKIRRLAATTARLRRKHRQLSRFTTGVTPPMENEDVFGVVSGVISS